MYERKEVGEEKEHHGIHEESRTAMNFRSLVAYIVVDSTEKQSDGYVSGQPELGQMLESNKITMVLKLRSFKMISALILYWAYVVHHAFSMYEYNGMFFEFSTKKSDNLNSSQNLHRNTFHLWAVIINKL